MIHRNRSRRVPEGFPKGSNRKGSETLVFGNRLHLYLQVQVQSTYTGKAPAPTPAPKHQQAPSACKSADVILDTRVAVTALAGAEA